MQGKSLALLPGVTVVQLVTKVNDEFRKVGIPLCDRKRNSSAFKLVNKSAVDIERLASMGISMAVLNTVNRRRRLSRNTCGWLSDDVLQTVLSRVGAEDRDTDASLNGRVTRYTGQFV